MKFKHPVTDYVEEPRFCFLWCLLFGCLYFAAMRCWTHAVISLVAAVVTGGFSWLVYPFFAKRVITRQYLRAGWTLVPA